jgi:predicted nucleic acid-binding protein
VPAFWAHEVLSALLVGEKRKRISASLIKSFLDDLALLPITLDTCDPAIVFSRIYFLCDEHGLTPYDAAYLELATRKGCRLPPLTGT